MEIESKQQIAFNYIDTHFEEAVSLWKTIVAMESPFWEKKAVDEVCSYLIQWCTQNGLHACRRYCETTGDGLVVSTQSTNLYRHGIALMAHIDTVHKIGAFGSNPVLEKDGWLYGPGVGDCKGGAVMALYTLLALRESGYTQRPVKLILVGNEEGGRPNNENFLPDELCGSDALFKCETGVNGKIVTSRKASIGAVFTVHGESGHVGHLIDTPANAIREAAYKILELENHSDYKDFIFSCGEIQGGTVFTSVPDKCTFKVNCRIRSKESIPVLEQILTQVAAKSHIPGTTSKVQLTGNIVPMAASSKNNALFAQFDRASRALGYGAFEPVHSGGGSDASYAVMLDIPAICSTGVIAENAHTLRERANIESLRMRAKTHILTILNLAD
jgi:glutamate carboxypeptidase